MSNIGHNILYGSRDAEEEFERRDLDEEDPLIFNLDLDEVNEDPEELDMANQFVILGENLINIVVEDVPEEVYELENTDFTEDDVIVDVLYRLKQELEELEDT